MAFLLVDEKGNQQVKKKDKGAEIKDGKNDNINGFAYSEINR
jgi:hypothetical protein